MLVLLSEVVIGIGGTVVLILSRFKLCFETGTKVERFIGSFIELELIGFTINPEDGDILTGGSIALWRRESEDAMELLKIFCLVIKADISGIEIGFDVSMKFIGASSVNEGMFKGGRDKCAVRLDVEDEALPKTDGGLLHGTVGRYICLCPSSFSLFREWGGFSMRSSVVLVV